MLSAVAVVGFVLADLVRPVAPEEYVQVMAHEALLHEPLPPEVREYYFVKGRLLAGLLRAGMTEAEVRGVLGVRPNGWVFDGERWMYSYSLLGLTVRYKLDGQVAEPGPEAVYSSRIRR
jgi:hypothetical protein